MAPIIELVRGSWTVAPSSNSLADSAMDLSAVQFDIGSSMSTIPEGALARYLCRHVPPP